MNDSGMGEGGGGPAVEEQLGYKRLNIDQFFYRVHHIFIPWLVLRCVASYSKPRLKKYTP